MSGAVFEKVTVKQEWKSSGSEREQVRELKVTDK